MISRTSSAYTLQRYCEVAQNILSKGADQMMEEGPLMQYANQIDILTRCPHATLTVESRELEETQWNR
jgi:hypothetical protein